MSDEEKCWRFGMFNDNCCCEVCVHQYDCSGNDNDDESEDE